MNMRLISIPEPTPPIEHKPTLDEQYPHKCHKCDKKLRFDEFTQANYGETVEHLRELWITKEVKLLCCHCHRNKETYQRRISGWRNEEDVNIPDFVRTTEELLNDIWNNTAILTGSATSTMPEDCIGIVEWNGEVSGVDTAYPSSEYERECREYGEMQERIIWGGTERIHQEGDIVQHNTGFFDEYGNNIIEYWQIINGVPTDPNTINMCDGNNCNINEDD